jgi:hypothetical protein
LGGFPWRCPYKAHDEGLCVTYRDSKDTFGPSTRTEAVFLSTWPVSLTGLSNLLEIGAL